MRLTRYHGLGNDYLVLDEGPPLTPGLARAICDRHRGIGSDGVLEPFETDQADLGVRIWNPDGSLAEKSGNGLRIFARWSVDTGRAGPAFSVHTGFEWVSCEVGDDTVIIEMGRARFAPADVPVAGEHPWVDHPLEFHGQTVHVTAVGLGNPHAVIFGDPIDWRAIGRTIEVHPSFPNRTNVQFARVLGPQRIAARIWERGAGETMASGSSACAVAAAAVRTGRAAAGPVEVVMEGGSLTVHVREDWTLRLDGPVERVGIVDVDPNWERRAGRP